MSGEAIKPMVVKIGGVALDNGDTTVADIVTLQKRGAALVVVHGGGNTVSQWLERQGTPVRFVRGERVTDAAALEVVTAVLRGVINAEITAAINAQGGRAVGLSGIDGGILQAVVRNDDMGYVGEIVRVDTSLLQALLKDGLVPVVAPLSQRIFEGVPTPPRHLNVNGDIAAGEIAVALGAARLVFLSDVAGVLDEAGQVIGDLPAAAAGEMVARGRASGGMIPKINASLRALSAGAVARIIDGTGPHALLGEADGGGTTIRQTAD